MIKNSGHKQSQISHERMLTFLCSHFLIIFNLVDVINVSPFQSHCSFLSKLASKLVNIFMYLLGFNCI